MAIAVWKVSTLTNQPRMNIKGESLLCWAAPATTSWLASPLAQKPQLVPPHQLPVLNLPPLIPSRWDWVSSRGNDWKFHVGAALHHRDEGQFFEVSKDRRKRRPDEMNCLALMVYHCLELKCWKFKLFRDIFEVETFSNLLWAVSYIRLFHSEVRHLLIKNVNQSNDCISPFSQLG